MTRFTSDTVRISKPQDAVFAFLQNLNNWEQLMPKERISDWQSTEKECSFQIKGLAKIGLALADSESFSRVSVKSHGKNPFDFLINIYLQPEGADQCSGYIAFEADINPMMRLMLEKPLTNFFNMLAGKLKEINS